MFSTPSFPIQGFELLKGNAQFSGQILGGCLESMYDCFDSSLYADSVQLTQKYKLFPTLEDWSGKILLLETSGELPSVELYGKMIQALKQYGIFDVVSGVLVGKPQNEIHYEEYKAVLLEELRIKRSLLFTILMLDMQHHAVLFLLEYMLKLMWMHK